MKIVNKKDFIRMPIGTVFAPWQPDIFCDCFHIKTGATHESYTKGEYCFCGALPLEPWIPEYEPTDNYPITLDVDFEVGDYSSNDIIDYELIAVLEEKDVSNLIEALKWALEKYKEIE